MGLLKNKSAGVPLKRILLHPVRFEHSGCLAGVGLPRCGHAIKPGLAISNCDVTNLSIDGEEQAFLG